MNKLTALLSVNTAQNARNFRLGLTEALMKRKHKVLVAAPVDGYAGQLIQSDCIFADFPMDSNGANPVRI